MGELGWGLIIIGSLMVLCVVIVIIACVHAVWLVKFVHSLLNKQSAPALPFSKKKSD